MSEALLRIDLELKCEENKLLKEQLNTEFRKQKEASHEINRLKEYTSSFQSEIQKYEQQQHNDTNTIKDLRGKIEHYN